MHNQNAHRHCLTLLVLLASPAWADTPGKVLDSMDLIRETTDTTTLALALNQRFSLAGIDTSTGNRCSLRLRPEQPMPVDKHPGPENLAWTATPNLPLSYTQGEWIAEQLWITFHFQRPVNCQMEVSADQQHLWLSVRPVAASQTAVLQQNLDAARTALSNGDTNTAQRLYQDILAGPPHPLQQDALEYLGVALERAQRYDEAEKTYQRYLNSYPDSPSRQRVAQRLQGLRLMQGGTVPTLKPGKQRRAEAGINWFGVIGNRYQTYRSQTGDEPAETLQSLWMTDVNLNSRYRSDDYDFRTVVSGGYSHDFEHSDLDPDRLSSAYLDTQLKPSGQQIRLGRQSSFGEGVLGRFDGLHYRKSLGNRFSLNGLYGLPVVSSRDVALNRDASLYGLSLDITPLQSPWQGNVFFIEQTREDFTDRRALGGETRYHSPSQSWLGYLDYDILFNELNTAMINANWYGKADAHYYLSADYRRSPILTVSNALIGQTLGELSAISQLGFNENLEEIALDRTATTETLSAGAGRRFSKHWRWAVDSSLWRLSDTQGSAGVPGFEGTDTETTLSLQLAGNDLWQARDASWLTLRYTDLTRSQLYALTADTRLPLGATWRLRPRILMYQRRYVDVSGTDTSIQPQLRLEYLPSPNWNFEADLGMEQLKSSANNFDITRRDYFMLLRADWLFD